MSWIESNLHEFCWIQVNHESWKRSRCTSLWTCENFVRTCTVYKSPKIILSLYAYISSQDIGLWTTNQSQPSSQKYAKIPLYWHSWFNWNSYIIANEIVEGGGIFFQLLELGYEKFPHNTTGSSLIANHRNLSDRLIRIYLRLWWVPRVIFYTFFLFFSWWGLGPEVWSLLGFFGYGALYIKIKE